MRITSKTQSGKITNKQKKKEIVKTSLKTVVDAYHNSNQIIRTEKKSYRCWLFKATFGCVFSHMFKKTCVPSFCDVISDCRETKKGFRRKKRLELSSGLIYLYDVVMHLWTSKRWTSAPQKFSFQSNSIKSQKN
jgi:hypothetical protein